MFWSSGSCVIGVDQPLTYPATDNLVEGKRKRRSNIGSPATPTVSSSSSTTPTRKVTESPRASTGVLSGKRKLPTSEEERSPAKRGRKSATVKPGKCSLLPHSLSDHGQMQGQLLERWSLAQGDGRSVLATKLQALTSPQVVGIQTAFLTPLPRFPAECSGGETGQS